MNPMRSLPSNLLVAAASLCGCAAGVPYVPPTVAVPPAFGAVTGASSGNEGTWWLSFDDPTLTSLVTRALASNLDVVRHSVEQLAYKQEQIAQNIAALQAIEEDIRLKMSFTPPSPVPAQQAASIPQPKPPQPKAQSSAVQSSPAPRPSPPAATLSR